MKFLNKRILNLAVVSATVLASFPHTASADLFGGAEKPQIAKGFADIVEPLLPAVVNIATVSEVKRNPMEGLRGIPENHPFFDFFRQHMGEGGSMEQKPRKAMAQGSGFVVDPSGYIVTNNHVIAEADEITIFLFDKTELKAKVVGRDPRTDLALLKVEHTEPLAFVKWGDSEKSRVGDWVIAIGNPLGMSNTVTTGIISTIERDINQGLGRANAGNIVEGYIQTDASINQGNSGGPMFNTNGEVIGINRAILSPSGTNIGIGFAIPSEIAQGVIGQLKEFGRTRRGWLGVRIQSVTKELAQALGLEKSVGALVAGLTKGGPGEKAGLKPRDVILEFNGNKIEKSMNLSRVVGESAINQNHAFKVWRDGKAITLHAKLGEFEVAEEKGLLGNMEAAPSAPMSSLSEKVLGMKLRVLTPADKTRLKIDTAETGLLVTGVDFNSDAAIRGFSRDDVITEIDGKPATSLKDLKDAAERAKSAKKPIMLGTKRGENILFKTLDPNKSDK